MKVLVLLIGAFLFGANSTTHANSYEELLTHSFYLPFYREANHTNPLDTLDRLRFIRLSKEDKNVQTLQDQINLLEPKKARPTVLEEIEFRVSNDEFQPQDQRYDLRFRPTNPLIRKKTEELYNIRKLQLRADASRELGGEILERYELIIAWLEIQQERTFVDERISINQKRIDWLKEFPGANFFDAKNFTQAHADVLKLWSKKTNLEIRIDELERTIASKLGDKMTSNYILSWGLRSTITTAHIHTFLRTTPNETLSQPLQVYLAQLALQETQIEQKIERANFDLGFIQTEYFPNRTNKSLLGISAGISLPLFQRDRANLMDLSLEEKERSLEVVAKQDEANQEQNNWKVHLELLLAKNTELQQLYTQMNLQEMQQTLQTMDEYEPLEALEWQEMQLDWQEIEHQWYFEMIKTYIGYLSSKGFLSSEPLIDWLDIESY